MEKLPSFENYKADYAAAMALFPLDEDCSIGKRKIEKVLKSKGWTTEQIKTFNALVVRERLGKTHKRLISVGVSFSEEDAPYTLRWVEAKNDN